MSALEALMPTHDALLASANPSPSPVIDEMELRRKALNDMIDEEDWHSVKFLALEIAREANDRLNAKNATPAGVVKPRRD